MGRKKKNNNSAQFALGLEPDVVKGIWSVSLIALAILSVLSFLDAAGSFGGLISDVLRTLAGWGMYVVPLLLLGLAGAFLASWGKDNNKSILIAAVLFSSSILGGFALVGDDPVAHGGYWGFIFSWPLREFLAIPGAVVVLIATATVSFIIGFNISIGQVISEFRERRREMDGALDLEEDEIKVKTLGEEEVVERKVVPAEKRPQKASEETLITTPSLSSKDGSFSLPPFDLLDRESGKPSSGDIQANASIIKRTLQNFGIDVEMGEVNVGPTVTQYTMKPAEGVKLSKVTGLSNDLSLALAAHPLRIEAPIPGRSLVGIEIPNETTAIVRLRDLIEKQEFQEAGDLAIALGRDVSGRVAYADLAKMPHLLIAGSTGSGKTIALNSVLLSLLYKNTPQQLRLLLIDPKRVEFTVYANIPHMLAPVVIENAKAVNALKWAVSEMERRFDALSRAGVRDIASFNANKKVVEEEGPLPYIVIVIDELADLMSSKGREVEALIVRIAQMARAVGIHLILATQRPSVEVITGTIKANMPARMAFQVASQIDSRTILDMAGADKLLGRGDMLFLSPTASKPVRIQGAFIKDTEIKKVSDFLRKQNATPEGEEMKELGGAKPSSAPIDFGNGGHGANEEDDMYEEAREVVIKSQKASASLLQRRLRVGYARAARLLDLLEENNVIGPPDGAKPRDVYVLAEDVEDEEGSEGGMFVG
ncbi:MAG: DNA translocase FtsK 4TM domain-containing protein [Candidatus Spechtbacterales bacterium]